MFIGHSGCCLYLVQTGKEIVVRKVSSSEAYNARLEAQCKKQIAHINPYMKVPKVFTSGYVNGLFYFDMEYIQGAQLSDHIKRIQISECGQLVRPLVSIVPGTLTQNQNAPIIFGKKLSALERQLPHDNVIIETLRILHTVDWSFIPESACHGDLTFDNILVQKDNLYLIDFLDSFYNSWMIDLAKLFQDIELRWSYRKSTIDDNTNIRLLVIRELFMQEINKLPSGSLVLSLLYNLIMLNALRILPYVTNEIDRAFIYAALKRMLG